jgi:hypothetical protein
MKDFAWWTCNANPRVILRQRRSSAIAEDSQRRTYALAGSAAAAGPLAVDIHRRNIEADPKLESQRNKLATDH